MKLKLIFLDIDGTILMWGKGISRGQGIGTSGLYLYGPLFLHAAGRIR